MLMQHFVSFSLVTVARKNTINTLRLVHVLLSSKVKQDKAAFAFLPRSSEEAVSFLSEACLKILALLAGYVKLIKNSQVKETAKYCSFGRRTNDGQEWLTDCNTSKD